MKEIIFYFFSLSKQHRKTMMRIVAVLVVSAALLGSCTALNRKFGLPDDNIFEEMIEKKIEEATGLDIDLSPESFDF